MPDSVKRYQARAPGVLGKFFDLSVVVLPFTTQAGDGETSAAIQARVGLARDRQMKRQGGLNGRQLKLNMARFTSGARRLLDRGQGTDGSQRVKHVAQTIADLAGAENVEIDHVAEAFALGPRRALSWDTP